MRKALTGRERARQWRIDNGWTLKALALAIGYLGHAPYERWESGRGSLPIGRLLDLAKITGIPVEVLAGPKQAETIRRLLRRGT